MLFDEVLQSLGVKGDSPEWKRAKTQLYINLQIDTEKAEFFGGQAVKFCQKTIRGAVEIDEREGYVFTMPSGLLVVCVAVDDMPLTVVIERKKIRVVEAETRMFSAEVHVKTNDDLYEMRVPKKQVGNLEKMMYWQEKIDTIQHIYKVHPGFNAVAMGLKTGLKLKGICGNATLPPLLQPDPESERRIAEIMKEVEAI